MKKLLFVSAILLAYSNVYSQERENRQNASILLIGDTLQNVIGWAYNDTQGKWYENKNAIEPRECTSYMISYVEQNILSLYIAKVSYKESTYYVLVYEKMTGDYKYPSIYKGWEDYKKMSYFIFESKEYEDFEGNIKNYNSQKIVLTTKKFGSITSKYASQSGEYAYSIENLLAHITKKINENQSEYAPKNCFVLNSQIIKGNKIVRFRLPESCSDKGRIDSGYFEVNSDEFLNILLN